MDDDTEKLSDIVEQRERTFVVRRGGSYEKGTPSVTPKQSKTTAPSVERELTDDENKLLDKLEKGEIGIKEMSGIVARKVFEKMLKNPDSFKFIDFFRSELLRQKEEETKIKDNHAREIINRFFAGKLPARYCPNCGHDMMPDIVDAESINPAAGLLVGGDE